MKIVLVSSAKKNWGGGASGVYLHLEQQLRQLNHQIDLFHLEDYLRLNLPNAIRKLAIALCVTQKILATAKTADVVETSGNLGWHLFQTLHSQKLANRPLLVTRLHGLEFKDEQARIDQEIAHLMKLPIKYKLLTRHWLNWQEFKTIKLSDLVICHTSREADAIITARLKPEHQVKVFPLGVDRDFLTNKEYRPRVKKLLWWGSWVERKGIFTFPRAFELAIRKLPDLSLTLGGTGTPAEEVLSYFPAELRSRIEVLPFVAKNQYQQILADHDLFLFPSLSEGFGLALLEAMAAGMPCITTLTGMYDWLEHGENCYIVPMNAPTALAQAIARLNLDLSMRKKIGIGGSKTASKLSWDKFGLNSEQVYLDHLNQLRNTTIESSKQERTDLVGV
jgi:glycosyltransferase involved in cell wall biosynthesis